MNIDEIVQEIQKLTKLQLKDLLGQGVNADVYAYMINN